VIRLHDPIVVVRKDAKPRFLNRFKKRFQSPLSPFEQARERLSRGQSIGVFPEATTNRHPSQLLRGQVGVAKLALESGIPVVPGGIRFPSHQGTDPIGDLEPLSVHFGPALQPPPRDPEAHSSDPVAAFHEQIMRAISTLSGKEWQPSARRTKYAVVQD
jgi:1-acyl-sn-glycerol-3-phosphate acyltransferase